MLGAMMHLRIFCTSQLLGARTVRRGSVAALLTLLWTVPAARAQSPDAGWPQTFGLADARSAASSLDEPQLAAPSRRLGVDLGAVPQVALRPIDAQALLRADAERARRDLNKVLRYGVGRDVRMTAADGNWYRLAAGGRLWTLDVVSPGALGLRLHLADLRLPPDAEIAVYAAGDPGHPVVYGGDQPRLGDPGRELWTPTLAGERARIEYRAAAGSTGRELPFTVDRLQHLYRDPVAWMAGKEAGPCHNDVTCFPEWADVSHAVAGLGTIFVDSLFCTGELLNSEAGDFTPYFLTAHHCLFDASEARSAEIFWFYQTATCGGPPPSLATVPHSPVTTLLATGEASDYTLLMVEGTLPGGVFWAGWTAAPVPDGTRSADIHHPSGDFKRISFGDRAHNAVCGGSDADHLRINWTDGPTEPGSSGSGIFRSDTQQLYGQLHCGPSACGNETNDSFGAFSATYPEIARLLARGSDDSLEPDNACEVARRAAVGTYPDLVVKSVDSDWYRLRVLPGRTLTVTINFIRGFGNVGATLYGECGAAPIADALGPGNTRRLTVTNDGPAPRFFRWQVYLRTNVRNTYTMTVTLE
jgi:lysyl endopeptidase